MFIIPKNENEAGFSLIEIMLSLVLSSIVLMVGFQLLTLGSQLNTRTETLLAANSIAFAKIQEYENKQFINIPASSDATPYEIEDFSSDLTADSGGFIRSGTAKVYSNFEPNSGSLKKLNVVINFQYGSRFRVIEYATFVQLGGVGR